MTFKMICVAPTGDRCGEGLVWHPDHAAIYWVDINRFLVHCFTPADKAVRTWFFDEPVTAVTLTDRDHVLALSLGSGVMLWEPSLDIRHERCFELNEWPSARLNDAGADPRGSLWVGSMSNNVCPDGSSGEVRGEVGILYRIDSDGTVTLHRREIGISNTIAWSPDGKRFYFGDSMRNTIWAYDYDPGTGSIANERPFFEGFPRGLPDGSAVDSAGYLWNCRYGGGCIVRVAPTGQIDLVIEAETLNPTNCTFGNPDRRTLFITSAALDAPPSDRLAGSLFALNVDIPGPLEHRYEVHRPDVKKKVINDWR
jgi:sugar lactone lactonase YvrE